MSTPKRAVSDEDAEQLARELHEQVRSLNYATIGPPGLTEPATVYTVLGNLGEAQYGFVHLLGQLDRFLSHEMTAGRLGHDSGHPADEWVDEAGQHLSAARIKGLELHRLLANAQTAVRNPAHSRHRAPRSRSVRRASTRAG